MRVVDIINGINKRKVEPREIDRFDRRAVVDYLTYEGWTREELAKLLHISERTVDTDRASNRKRHATLAKVDDPDTYIGNLIRECEVSKAKLRKLSRSKGVSIDDARKCEVCIATINKDLVEALFKIGKLPSAAMKVEIDSDVKHSGSVNLTREELERDIKENKGILERAGFFRSAD